MGWQESKQAHFLYEETLWEGRYCTLPDSSLQSFISETPREEVVVVVVAGTGGVPRKTNALVRSCLSGVGFLHDMALGPTASVPISMRTAQVALGRTNRSQWNWRLRE